MNKTCSLSDEICRDNAWISVFGALEIDPGFLRVKSAEFDGIPEETKVGIDLIKLGLYII